MPLILLCTLLGAAPDWPATFDPAATASYLDRPNASVIVLSGGGRTDSQRSAERALVAALRASGQTRLVMSSESVAATPDDSDEVLVQKASPLPVDLIVVLRLFPGPTETAVATIYDKSGTALSALSGLRGQVLAAREGSSRQIAGRTAVAETIKAANPEQPRPAWERSRDSEKIEFSTGAMVNVRTGQVTSTWVIPWYRNKRLVGARYYEVVGRPDLVKAYHGRVGAKAALIVSGSLAAVAGGLMALFTLSPPCAIYNGATSTCLQLQYPSLVVPGLIGGAVGVAALLVGAILPSDPLSPQARYQLAEEFNQQVDQRRKISSREEQRPRIVLGFSPLPGGAAGSLSVIF